MDTNELSQLLLNSPLSAVPAVLMVVLTALTMRSVVKREEAMIPRRRAVGADRETYVSRWRTPE
ncbi:hypothetical protein [Mycobacterium sp. SMC-4]|uniref:hypothetical protein n=1 Tax=Mycobacterium sp. SMC-4 TaxID=2857059 RepID=UPI0021B3FD27|nr:hypothetical protein [Mycobacterium sp. SMC-4]UXA17447.1 hypothetical protein KXD98_22410 [Mycobacterium sp. SMC-4]